MRRAFVAICILTSASACAVTPSVALNRAVKAVGAADTPASAGVAPIREAAAPVVERLQLHPGWPTLKGALAIDASYALATSNGLLLGPATGQVLGAGQVISNNAGNLVSENGTGLISDAGGNIIANNGGTLIANNGGGLISDVGGSLTSKVKYALADVAGPPPLTLGTELPAAGMLVEALSLHTHKPLAIGLDGSGQPVYGIYTNLKGDYAISVPPAEAGNVLVTALVPGSTDQDLNYALLGATGTSALKFDEETAVVTKLVRTIIADRLIGWILVPPVSESASTDPLNAILGGFLGKLAAAEKQANTATLPPATALALAYRVGDEVLSAIDFSTVTVLTGGKWNGPANELAIPFMADALRGIDQGAAPVLAANRHAFDDLVAQQPLNFAKLAAHYPEIAVIPPVSFKIAKPADVSDFVARGTIAIVGGIMQDLEDETLQRCGFADPTQLRLHMEGAGDGIELAIGEALVGSPDLQQKIIDEVVQSQAASPAP